VTACFLEAVLLVSEVGAMDCTPSAHLVCLIQPPASQLQTQKSQSSLLCCCLQQ